MKLRIEDNSLRLRLSEAEVQQFADQGRVACTVPLGPLPTDQLVYALERAEQEEFQVIYEAGALTVTVPASLAQSWTSTDQNGLVATLPLASGQFLRILVEKDLDCRH
ncbi:hypothetical protein LJY25_03845 [Hymenobacter sp. BT175]|uniref:DUF7009 family protein n=1 Tax=Hymenobacter translucens TaxID=2886507 RepID=UPI001D0E327F|nr:hypothetical protein [Hymenobacter translucens]MCC2545565.1 hypothetical protein [Hymenobacter translucens]